MDIIFKREETVFEPWQKWFAWRPVTVHGSRVWFKFIYRRLPQIEWPSPTVDDSPVLVREWQYGTIFDVLKGSV